MAEPMIPRITKSTAVAAIKARFENEEALLERFELAKAQANLWDGERDGIREVIKTMSPGQYGKCVLSKSETAAVCYPNADGKFHLEETLQTDIPSELPPGIPQDAQILVFAGHEETAEAFLDTILSYLQHGKEKAVQFLATSMVGHGRIVDNCTLYSKTSSEKATISVMP